MVPFWWSGVMSDKRPLKGAAAITENVSNTRKAMHRIRRVPEYAIPTRNKAEPWFRDANYINSLILAPNTN